MSGTMTVRELIVELLDQDMDDLVFIWRDDAPHADGLVCAGDLIAIDERPSGVYLFARSCDGP